MFFSLCPPPQVGWVWIDDEKLNETLQHSAAHKTSFDLATKVRSVDVNWDKWPDAKVSVLDGMNRVFRLQKFLNDAQQEGDQEKAKKYTTIYAYVVNRNKVWPSTHLLVLLTQSLAHHILLIMPYAILLSDIGQCSLPGVLPQHDNTRTRGDGPHRHHPVHATTERRV